MSLVIPPGFGSAAFIFTGPVGTEPYVTTLGVDLSAAGGDFVGAANTIKSSFKSALDNFWSKELVLDRVTLAVGQDGPGGSVDSSTSPYSSTRAGNNPPTAMSAIARKVTNELGRSGRGRMFLPGFLNEAAVDESGRIDSGSIAAIGNGMNDFLALLTDPEPSTWMVPTPAVLLHGPSIPPKAPSPITAFQIAPVVGWIRGRIR